MPDPATASDVATHAPSPSQLSTAAQLALVALGGAAGACLRFAASLVLTTPDQRLPLATLAVNAAGCLAIGALVAWADSRHGHDTAAMQIVRLAVGVGFLGGLTTFSTFGYETLSLATTGRWQAAAANVALNLTASLAAVTLGWLVARAIVSPAHAP